MVDHDRKVGVTRAQAKDNRQMPRPDQRIEAQAGINHRVHGGRDFATQNPLGLGHILQHRPQTLEQRCLDGERRDPLGCIGRGEIRPAHHTADQPLRGGCGLEEELSLGPGRRRLHQHGGVDIAEQRTQVLQPVIAMDRQVRRQPFVIAACQSPDMVVRIDDHGWIMPFVSSTLPQWENPHRRRPHGRPARRRRACGKSGVSSGPRPRSMVGDVHRP